MTAADIAIAEASRLHRYGLNPIAINNRIGHCPIAHAAYRDEGMPIDVLADLARSGSHGLQCPTGVNWGLAVVDVDGPLGLAWWESQAVYRSCPPTVTGRTPRDGWQFWYAIPPGLDALPSADLWKGPGEHQGVELLADRRMARCYPSYKLIDGRKVPYRWVAGRGLGEMPMATLPRWLAEHARDGVGRLVVQPHQMRTVAGVPKSVQRALNWQTSRLTDWRQVRDAVGDKLALAERWGLRVVGRQPNDRGWVTCRSIFREDRHPSARFQVHNGGYWESTLGGVLNFFDVAIALGAYPDFKTVIRELGRAS